MHESAPKAPAHSNPVVARCCSAWDQAFQQARTQGKGDIFASLDAAKAHRQNLPALDNSDVIRDFIACGTQGMLLGAIAGQDGTRLLYAAQVANTTLRNQSKKQPAAA
jgi:hypothetical protein